MRQHVAVYARRSVDPKDLAVSVANQEKTCRRYAAERWPDLPVEAYVDNSLSAADPKITRPSYLRLLHDVRAGKVVAVVAREQSRITRQPSEWETLCTAMQLAGITEVHTTTAGTISVTEGSRLPGRIMAVVDAEYVEQVKVKVRGAMEALAEEGRPTGRVPYGYRRALAPDGRHAIEPDPITAPVVQRIVKEIGAGSSLGLVARGLMADGIPTPRGAKVWHRETLRHIATSPTIVGDRIHQGEVKGPGLWTPIVSRKLWRQAGDMLKGATVTDVTGRARTIKRSVTTRRRYLFTSGLSVCANCGTDLIASQQGVRNGPRAPAYACPHPSLPKGGCGKVSIMADILEPHVLGIVEGWLDGFVDEINRHLTDDDEDMTEARAELADIDERLIEAAERVGRGSLLDFEHAAMRRPLLERRAELVRVLGRQHPAEMVSVEDVRRIWRAGDPVALRSVLSLLVQPVVVHSAFRDGRRLGPNERLRISPTWE